MFKSPWFWKDINIVSLILYPLGILYSWISKCRYLLQIPVHLGSNVICIGNATLGGSGKTPLAIAIGKMLLPNKHKIAYACKNYRHRIKEPTQVLPSHATNQVIDEAILLSRTAPTFIAQKRNASVKAACEAAEIVISDDGFQNNSFHKDLSILAVSADENFGNNFIFPAGPLRESLEAGLKKSDLVCMINETKNSHKYNRTIVEKHFDKEKTFRTTAKYDLHGPRNKKYIAFCGIASPSNFFTTLKKHKINLVDQIDYPDHWNYTEGNLSKLFSRAKKLNAGLVTTEKDFVRLDKNSQKKIAYLRLQLKISNEKKFLTQIKEHLHH